MAVTSDRTAGDFALLCFLTAYLTATATKVTMMTTMTATPSGIILSCTTEIFNRELARSTRKLLPRPADTNCMHKP